MMIPDNVYIRIKDFHYRLTAPEDLINLVDESLLQAIWDSQESLTDDELVALGIKLIKKYDHLNH
ncbi:hypothetical protein IGI37_002891 [Enterococcus sp. AZ194]|uniref:hypothetical protein n=1 Tax=Enterococcus sp. AZ194 TaxID=2774629 RepID=UPI003F264171